jgi:hypothetical protein
MYQITETWLSRLEMEERLKSGISINNLLLLEPDTTTNHGISRIPEEPATCRSGAPTPIGSKSSSIKTTSSSTGQTTRFLMSMTQRTLKDRELESRTTKMLGTNNGKLFILTRQRILEAKDSTRSLVSTSIDHSTLDLECQCRESLSASEPITLLSRDGETTPDNNSGTSMKSPRPSRTTTGSLTVLTSKAMEDHLI